VIELILCILYFKIQKKLLLHLNCVCKFYGPVCKISFYAVGVRVLMSDG